MKILMVVGSLRARSFNRQLAAAIIDTIGERAEVAELGYAEVPLMNQDVEWPTPEAVAAARAAVGSADGIWFCCPEYNGYFPGAVKNLIDWLSRPTVEGDMASPTAIAGKAVTVSGAAGRSGSRNMQAQLTNLLTGVRANVMAEPTVGISLSVEAWTTDVLNLDDETRAAIAEQVDAFLSFIG